MNDASPAGAGNHFGPQDFSLVLGGPLFQLLRRAHLTGDVLELVGRRVAMAMLVTWVPLLLLSLAQGYAFGHKVTVPFLLDVDVHARFLLALPLLILAELVVHQRMRKTVEQFLSRGLIDDSTRAQFDAAIAAALRLRNSVTAEIILILFVYVVGVGLIWRTQVSIDAPTWYRPDSGVAFHPSLAGWWYGLVSLPLMQFILLRWYFRLAIWARFLWQVSRIELKLVPTHPDRTGGLGFLPGIVFAFSPLVAGQGVLLAGVLADKIFFTGAALTDFKPEIIAVVTVIVSVVFGPLFVFTPQLSRAKRKGSAEYGILAQRYMREFDTKWLRGGAAPGEQLLGTADLQSMADMGNSYQVVSEMKLLPISRDTIIQLVFMTLLPVAPLVLTLIPLAELLDRFIGIVF